MNGFDLSTVTNIYLGSTPVKEVYMGTKLIWPTGAFDYSTEYFTIESLEDGNQIGIVDSNRPSISISTDKQTWTTVTPNATPTYFITLNTGEKVYIKGSNNQYYVDNSNGYFTSTGKFNVYGNIMSLVYADDFKNKTTLSSKNVFKNLFYNVNKLISAEHLVLPATTLSRDCYANMFEGCTSLTTAPELPATVLAEYCYANMFEGCTSLTTAPELPATTLVYACYYSMFQGCTSLTTAPELPATTLVHACYYSMFQGCTSLTKAAELPATELASSCYNSMFKDCTSLTTAPELPATTLAGNCYNSMFSDCTSLTKAPELPATTLEDLCYFRMFQGCTSLTKAPELPATVLVEYCYYQMFQHCSSLTTAPELPATTLTDGCYSAMFEYCTSLTKAPELPATTLTDDCYAYMFNSCTSLNYIKMLATDVSASSCLEWWVHNVAPSGTFVKDASTTLPTGDNGIPNGWTITNFNIYSTEYFTIESLEDGNQIGVVDSNRPSISISTDKQTWTTVTPNAAPTYFITLNTGEKVYIKGSNNLYYVDSSNGYFTSTGKFNVSGNIMSLLYEDNFKNKTTLSSENVFKNLFYKVNKLISAEHLVLPATELASSCYNSMFKDCTSLTTAPELPATTLVSRCYSTMFAGCLSLTKAPELPATTLADNCYNNMFSDCTSLTTAPELPATTLTYSCYAYMFMGCSSLNYIKMLATDVSARGCLKWWVIDVATSGTFVKDASTTLPTGDNGIPNGWTITNFIDYSTEYFTIESLEDNNQIGIANSNSRSISISTDKRTWTTVTPNATPTYFITLNTGEKVYIKGSNNVYYDSSWSTKGYFTSTGKFNVSGNIMSLIYADDFKNKTTLSFPTTFKYLFNDADKLISAEHLVLPATTLSGSCYCNMFQGCSSLTTAPELPATTLADSCYTSMFQGCTSLTKAPELPATTLVFACYYYMFKGCSSLNYIKMLATDVSAVICINYWVEHVAPSGTFVKDASTTLPTGHSGIPDGWTVETV